MWERNSNTECAIRLDGQEMESVRTFKYLESVMSKDGGMDKERECSIREKGGTNTEGNDKKQKS